MANNSKVCDCHPIDRPISLKPIQSPFVSITPPEALAPHQVGSWTLACTSWNPITGILSPSSFELIDYGLRWHLAKCELWTKWLLSWPGTKWESRMDCSISQNLDWFSNLIIVPNYQSIGALWGGSSLKEIEPMRMLKEDWNVGSICTMGSLRESRAIESIRPIISLEWKRSSWTDRGRWDNQLEHTNKNYRIQKYSRPNWRWLRISSSKPIKSLKRKRNSRIDKGRLDNQLEQANHTSHRKMVFDLIGK